MKKLVLGVMAVFLLAACSKEEENDPPILNVSISDVPKSEIWYSTSDSRPLILPNGNNIKISYGVAVNMVGHTYENGLGKLVFDRDVTEIHGVFNNCSTLKEVWLPNGITMIGGFTFSGCSDLEKVHIPDGVSSIANFAFYGCSNLSDIVIPNEVTSIGYAAFQGCGALSCMVIPENVMEIGFGAFCDCEKLEKIYCHPAVPPFVNTNYTSDNEYENILDTSIPVYVPQNSLEEYASRRWWKSLSLVGYQYE